VLLLLLLLSVVRTPFPVLPVPLRPANVIPIKITPRESPCAKDPSKVELRWILFILLLLLLLVMEVSGHGVPPLLLLLLLASRLLAPRLLDNGTERCPCRIRLLLLLLV
jgi:hypothetical protein